MEWKVYVVDSVGDTSNEKVFDDFGLAIAYHRELAIRLGLYGWQVVFRVIQEVGGNPH